MNKPKLYTLILILFITATISANTIVVNSQDTGWYDHRGYSLPTDSNFTGLVSLSTGDQYYGASYFVFCIPEITEDIVGIQLYLELTYYSSYDDFEDVRISAVSTPIEDLILSHTGSGTDPQIYNDLTDGPEIGVLHVPGDALDGLIGKSTYKTQGPLLYCTFNDIGKGLVMGASQGQIAIGLSLIDIAGSQTEGLGFNSGYGDDTMRIHQLHITTIPEPATVLLLFIGACAIKPKTKR